MKKRDTVIVDDKNGRRKFIRAGAAFLIAGSTSAISQEESEGFRSDCDGVGGGGEKNSELAGSDNDTGTTADRPGCGRKKPVITEYRKDGHKRVKVAKVIG